MKNGEKRKALVWGAGGFVGGELLRLLVGHPYFLLIAALSETYAGRCIGDVYPALKPWTNALFSSPNSFDWDLLTSGSWTVFSTQPHGDTMKTLPTVIEKLSKADVNFVDLSGDFRLNDIKMYEKYYGREHVAKGYLNKFVYGLPELNRSAIETACYISNPGCFATGAQLAIIPAAASGAEIHFVAVDGKTGSSGAGAKPRETTHHPNRMNNFRAYMQLKHQHIPEIVGGWNGAGGSPDTEIAFVPQMAPMVRGIFTTAYIFSEKPFAKEEVIGWYEKYYSSAPFVKIVDDSPSVAEVWGSNRCDLSVLCEGRKIVVCTAIDNLVKGAAGQAIQNANIMNGWDETSGLLVPAPAPI